MGTLKVNGDISATGNISASSFLGNASSANKWFAPRTFTIGHTGKSVDGTQNISWTLEEIGASYYHSTSWDFTKGHSNGYVTFDQSATTGGPSGEAWVNGFVSTHNNYLSSYIVNGHRGDNWYLGYSEHDTVTKNPTWRKIIHDGNYTDYTVTKTGSGASGTWNISINGNAHNANYLDGYDSTSFAMASHNHTSLTGITSLAFNAHSDDGATIKTTINSSSTYLDFNLVDDGESDFFRWNFGRWDSATSSQKDVTLMTLTCAQTANTAKLVVNGTIQGNLDWNYITNKPSTFTPSDHNHNLLTAGGEGSTASKRNNHYSCAVLTGGWGSNDAGYGYQYGTTLDISGYSTWYHRLAFWTNGTIEYWQGINTDTMTKIGRLLTSANYTSYCAPASHSHNYATLAAPNNLMHSGNEFTFAPAGYSGGVWFNFRTAGWDTNGNITEYNFGNGRGGLAPAVAQYFRTMNYGSGAPGSSTPGYGSSGAIYYQV